MKADAPSHLNRKVTGQSFEIVANEEFSMKEVAERSFHPLNIDHLKRLADLALADLDAFFQRNKETAQLYRDRMLGLSLCQGSA